MTAAGRAVNRLRTSSCDVSLEEITADHLPPAECGEDDGVTWLRMKMPGDQDYAGMEYALAAAANSSHKAVALVTSFDTNEMGCWQPENSAPALITLPVRRSQDAPVTKRGTATMQILRPQAAVTPGNRHGLELRLVSMLCVMILSVGSAVAADGPPRRGWSSDLLSRIDAWPHSERDAVIAVMPEGLRVAVAEGRAYAIAAASQLAIPRASGLLRVQVAELGNGAKWFIRLYGELRQAGQPRTVGVAQDETVSGEVVFYLDPRLVTLPDAPLQLQLGVEGPPGAYAVFHDVTFLPAEPRANRQPRRHAQPGQLDIPAVELMPNLPEPFELIDWRAKAQAYDRFVFDLRAEGKFLPLLWLDDTHLNTDRRTFGLPSYVGSPDQMAGVVNAQEGINCMGAVLGATLVGIDKSRQEHDYVAMCEAYFNSRNGLHLVLNRQHAATGGSFWYELFPHIVFYALADRYRDHDRLTEIMCITADRWQQVCLDLADEQGIPNFNHTSFDFATRRAADNGQWREPDAAAAVAWLQYAAWKKFGDNKYLLAAETCLQDLQRSPENPYYEILLPFGALTAARMNAELGRSYDVDRLLNWCFGISDCRGGWGVMLGNWGGYDCDGLLGSIDNRCGYSFAMNTFVQAGALLPLARYDTRYARGLAKWMLNVANSARLFYPGALPPGHATSEDWDGDPQHVIAYEGLRYAWLGKSPCATGDPQALNWGPKTDLGLYGSSFVGMLGALVQPTSDSRILQLDCLATDFFRPAAYPTYVCYNPYQEDRSFDVRVSATPCDLYDAVQHAWVARGVSDVARITLPPDAAAVLVLVPAGRTVTREGHRTSVDGVVIDWRDSSPEES